MPSKSCLAALLLATSVPALHAQYGRPALTKGIQFQQKLNSPVPLDLVFHDEGGNTVPLRQYFGEKPVVLSLVYFRCPSLCPMSLRETVSSLRRVPLEPGRDYNVVIVSFDPTDTPAQAAEQKALYSKQFRGNGFDSGFHFLTGDGESVSRLASAVGFGYRKDPASNQYVHAGGIMVATPEGKMSRYFFGVDYVPADLRMALVEAAQHKIGSPIDYVLLFCFQYDPSQGRYTMAIINVLKIAAGLTVIALAALLYFLMRTNNTPKPPARWKEVQNVH